MPLEKAISLENITFCYPNASKPTLRNIDLSIPAHSKVGFVGSTGSGKTTIIDVILGLLEPQDGRLIVDSNVVSPTNRRQWQRSIGYVPQQIYLADDSIAANIAFGVKAQEIDQSALELAAKAANLEKLIVEDLPNGYATNVGERGVRLSGGQRQRIGIARALYHAPQVLILDEATSALDNLTEKAVMQALNNLDQKVTVILIAHRLSTVRQCDQIHLMENGRIKATGTFDQLAANSEYFAAMTSAA